MFKYIFLVQNFNFLIVLDMLEHMLVYYFYKWPESSSSCLKDSSRRQNLFFYVKIEIQIPKKYTYRPVGTYIDLIISKMPRISLQLSSLGELQVASWNLTIISYLVLDIYKRLLLKRWRLILGIYVSNK